MNPNYRNLALWAVIAVLLIALFNLFQAPQQRGVAREVPYSEFIQEVEADRVEAVTITGNRITGTYSDSSQGFQTYTPNDANLVQRLEERGVTINARPETDGSNSIFGYLLSWLPMILSRRLWNPRPPPRVYRPERRRRMGERPWTIWNVARAPFMTPPFAMARPTEAGTTSPTSTARSAAFTRSRLSIHGGANGAGKGCAAAPPSVSSLPTARCHAPWHNPSTRCAGCGTDPDRRR